MEISAVKLRNSYQINYVDTNNIFVNQNALCVVETEHGVDIGNVVKCPRYQADPNVEVKGKLLRIINDSDREKLPEIEDVEKQAFVECKDKAKQKNLDMKLIAVKCLFDKTKIIFYFVAENRVDFRELVRELASVFRTRIEMRQIGVRDEAKLVGGFGPCGKELCCVHQIEEFEPVSIKMAKEQNLNLNSLKISGMCGRLLCCLGYEYNTYCQLNKNMPHCGTQIRSNNKDYTVLNVDSLKESILIRDGDRLLSITKADIEKKGDAYFIKKDAIERITHPEDESNEEEDEDDFSYTF